MHSATHAAVRSPEGTGTPAARVVAEDLAYMCAALRPELAALAGKQLLITGGAGFLGYYLVQLALHWNARSGMAPVVVTVVDNYARGMPAWLEQCRGDGALTLLRHDMSTPLPATLGTFDYIVHAASIASPVYYRQHPIETMDANVNGLRALLEHARQQAARGHPVAGLLFFSSSEIYGDPAPDSIPTPETYRGNVSCTGPRACYDEAKRYGETLCVNFARHAGVPATIARPFNNYGPGLKITDGRVVPDFARDVLAGRNIVMLSDGSPRRTFCYVADAVIGYYKVLVRGRPGEAYNIGVEEPEISVRELAELVAAQARELFGYAGSVEWRPAADGGYLVDNPTRRCPAIAKARAELDYRPAVTLADGVRRTLLWYAEHQQAVEG
jgi:nucleoside-diphosphate-sugar epimerase